jgi:hypothetical protein
VLTLLLLATLAGAGGCCSGLTGLRSGSCLDGSWELVSAKYTLRDGRVLDPEPGLQSLKILRASPATQAKIVVPGEGLQL